MPTPGRSTNDPPDAARAAPPSPSNAARPSRRRRRLHHVAIATLLGLALGFVLVTRSGLLKYIILPQVESLLECDASCGRVLLATSGELILYDLTLDAPRIDGPAGRLLYARKVQVELALDSWWPGSLRVKGIRLFDPVVRISQAEDLSLNMAQLFPAGGATQSGDRIPEVEIIEGTLELGEHGDASYVPIVSLDVQGGIRADHAIDGLYHIDLSGDPRTLPGTRSSLDLDAKTQVSGFLDLANGAFKLTADNINLSELSAQSAPRSFRGYWEQLRLRGLIPSSTISYDPAQGLAARFDLQGVDLAIPVPVTEEEEILSDTPAPPREDNLDMRNVSGEIRFDPLGLHASLTGLVEDLHCRVQLDTEGLSIDAPLTCSIGTDTFTIQQGQNPRLLPFAPAFAQRVFRRFSSPEATLEGQLVLQRVVENGVSRWLYDGEFNLKDGAAMYEQFPYPFVNIEATFIFDQDKFEMPLIRGVGKGTGASLLASGIIAPPGAEAEVFVDVTVVDVPMDEVFKASIPEHPRVVYDLLFNEAAHRAHVEAGRIIDPRAGADLEAERDAAEAAIARLEAGASPNDPDAPAPDRESLGARIAEIDAALARRFTLGGKAQLKLNIHRPPGADTNYDTTIDFRIPRAGIVPAAFPYPATARDVVIRMSEGTATIEPFPLEGLTGATGTLEGSVQYSLDPGGSFTPQLLIEAQGVPLDDLLIEALPRAPIGEAGVDADALPEAPRDMLEALNLEGEVACVARIAPRDEQNPEGALGFDVRVTFEDLAARPTPELTFEEVDGSVHVTNTSLDVERISGLLSGSPFSFDLDARFGEATLGVAPNDAPRAPTVVGSFESAGLDVEQRIESILGLAAPEHARTLERLRAEHHPTGTLDARLDFEERDNRLTYRLDASNLQDVAFTFDGQPVRLRSTRGRCVIARDVVRFDRFRADVRDAPEAAPASIALDGVFAREPGIAGELTAAISAGRFESSLVRAVAARAFPALLAPLDTWRPEGVFDLSGVRRAGADHPPTYDWSLEPRSLSFTRRGRTIAFDTVEGRIAHDDDAGGVVEGLRLRAPTWGVAADGTWSTGDGVRADLDVALDAARIDDELIASLPHEVAEILDAIDLEVSQRVALRDGRLHYWSGAPTGETRLSFDAALDFSGLSARPGVPIADARGGATISYALPAGAPKPEFDVEVACDEFRVFGIELTDGRARLTQGDRPDVHLLRSFEARSNDGRITGRAAFADAASMGLDAPGRSYEIQAEVTGVRFGPLLAQMSRARNPDSAEHQLEPVDRGVLDASFSVFGAFASDTTRRGRGTLRVEGGDVLNMPGIVPLLELSNLQAPGNERVDLAFTDFFIEGDRLLFDKLYMYSPSIRITGEGRMTWSTTALDLSVETRGMRQIPLLSDILTSVREEIVSTRVTGTLYDPQFRYEQLSGARRLFDTMLGGSGDARDER